MRRIIRFVGIFLAVLAAWLILGIVVSKETRAMIVGVLVIAPALVLVAASLIHPQ